MQIVLNPPVETTLNPTSILRIQQFFTVKIPFWVRIVITVMLILSSVDSKEYFSFQLALRRRVWTLWEAHQRRGDVWKSYRQFG